jgi:tetratricopeptide (TPR) repeat protein/tRNA A-37 threonylcarbamoyl transferase component Bud32
MHDPASPAADPFRNHLDRSLSGSYRIERELGGGGMSRVFLAEETALGRRVVVKVLAPELTHDVSAERFAREIRLSARLQHPNIVPVLAAGVAQDVPYYTMPFIEGESLRARLERLAPGQRLSPAQAIPLLRDVARALNYAHSLGVVHRDIKPENVLLGYDAAMVADFGVAKALLAARTRSPAGSHPTLTQDGVSLGTPAYMSPEQAAGDPTVDHRADLYSWGILAYEVLAGTHPFAGRHSVHALVSAHLTEEPKPLQVAAPGLSPAALAIVTRCLAKSPADRPASAEEIVAALGQTTTGGVSAAPRRLRRLAPLAAGIVVIAGVVFGLLYAGSSEPTIPVSPASQRVNIRSPGYDAYLRGKVRVTTENPSDNDAAISALQQAIAADPSLAPAHAALSRAYTIKAFYFASDHEKKQLNEDAEVEVEKALRLDPELGEAHFARGLMLWTPGRRFPHEQAVQSYKRAIALDSTLDEAHHQLGLVYLHVGLLDRGQHEVERALAINPGNTLARFRLGVIELYRGEYARAYDIFNSTPLEKNPTLWAFQTATALFRLERVSEATELLDKFLEDYPKDEGGVGHSVRAMLLARAGRRAEAEREIAQSIALGRTFGHFHHTAYNIASAYALLGKPRDAMTWLQLAADEGFPCYPLFASDTQLDPIRTDPGFKALLAKMKADWEERGRTL